MIEPAALDTQAKVDAVVVDTCKAAQIGCVPMPPAGAGPTEGERDAHPEQVADGGHSR
jgi:hypothetical protein